MSDITTIYQEDGKDKVYQGAILKMNVHLEPIDGLHMDSYNFICVAYCSSAKKIIVSKNKCWRVDADNYMFTVDTSLLTVGDMYIMVLADIPDSDMPDAVRVEPVVIKTGLEVARPPFDFNEIRGYGVS